MKNIFFSIDIETLGWCGGLHSMISLGCAAIDLDTGEIVGKYRRNLKPLPDLPEDTSVQPGYLSIKEFWAKHPEAWKRSTEDARDAAVVIPEFVSWIKSFNLQKPIAACWRPFFDMAFLRYYFARFDGVDAFNPNGAVDVRTVAALALKWPLSEVRLSRIPDELRAPFVNHTHDALEDATEQAYILYNSLQRIGGAL